MRRRLRANIFGLGERDVAMVFDDEPIESRTSIRARVFVCRRVGLLTKQASCTRFLRTAVF